MVSGGVRNKKEMEEWQNCLLDRFMYTPSLSGRHRYQPSVSLALSHKGSSASIPMLQRSIEVLTCSLILKTTKASSILQLRGVSTLVRESLTARPSAPRLKPRGISTR